jgi:sulfonate transport system substrate-binding protein
VVGGHPFAVRTWIAGTLIALALMTACGAGEPAGAGGGSPIDVRLGYFPNITHATAIAGVKRGFFAHALGAHARLRTETFNAGPEAVTALVSDALDATYIGPNPAINAFAKSHGEAIRIISGATSGGAFLVVRPQIHGVGDLRGKTIASPQLGNTQDVALRSWLASKGLRTTTEGGGEVSVVPQENALTLQTFKSGDIDGAWVPEPWAGRLVLEGGGKVLVDERNLWPAGRYVTTLLIVRTQFLREHRDIVARLLRGQVLANEYVNEHPAEAKRTVGSAIAELTGKALPAALVDRAWSNLTFTNDPVAASLRTSAAHAVTLGLLDPVDLAGIYDLGPLNEVLRVRGVPEVRAA